MTKDNSEKKEEKDGEKYFIDGNIWTKQELDKTLYAWDETAQSIILELHKPQELVTNDKEEEEDVWEIDLPEDTVHVIIFYAAWCPHCQRYKPHFIELAKEVMSRSIAVPVKFYALSCGLYEAVCSIFNINGYPTILGWKTSADENAVTLNGANMPNLNAELLGEYLDLPLATAPQEEEDDYEDDEMDDKMDETTKMQKKEAKKAKQLKKVKEEAMNATKLQLSNMEYESSYNERYHNAFVSLIQSIKTASRVIVSNHPHYQQVFIALQDFLQLVDWATPHRQWKIHSMIIPNLLQTLTKYSSSQYNNKDSMDDWYKIFKNEIETSLDKIRKRQDAILLGSILPVKKRHQSMSLGADAPLGLGKIVDLSWTTTCTHDQPAMGYTCGLWELFHIISIGATIPVNQHYGFQKGYDVSAHVVAYTIRNFIQYFFKCDVCRRNFVEMYDSCGHDHCTRLGKNQPFLLLPEQPNTEMSVWLWEVHNAVNLRLMKERTPPYRNVTKEELIASQFPSFAICPNCWKQNPTLIEGNNETNFIQWDSDNVYLFLKKWYWPDHYPNIHRQDTTLSIHYHDNLERPIGTFGLVLVMIPFVLAAFIIARDNYSIFVRYLITRPIIHKYFGQKHI